MLGFLHQITVWLLLAVVLGGHLPALLHRSQCLHVENLEQSQVTGSLKAPLCVDHCCKSHKEVENSPQGSEEASTPSLQTLHRCDDCIICQSLLSAKGFPAQLDDAEALELVVTKLHALEEVVPFLSRFGISQSRAPPFSLS